ncbi:MAG: class I SAM-dependent methyltransferase [Deltaproteobacteria bacterium]|nr:class I SAM-dependent methyltransferase [Deltaproteobacteria bacterium]
MAALPIHAPCANCGLAASEQRELIGTTVCHKGRFHGAPLTIVACPRCGLVYQNPRPTEEQLNRFYTQDYYKEQKGEKKRLALDEKFVLKECQHRWLTQHLTEIRDQDIVDVGSGYGQWLQLFSDSNRLLGIESSERAIQYAREWYGIEMRSLDFLGSDLEPQSFDLVTGLAIIEHFLDPLKALVAANRLLRPGGHIYLRTPDYFGLVLRSGIHKYFTLTHTYYFSLATLSSLLGKAGFEVVASERIPPLLETSSLLHRRNYFHGQLQVLARKRQDTSLDAACQRPYSGDDVEEVFAALHQAQTRDRVYTLLSRGRKGWVGAPLVRASLSLASRIAPKPPSKYEVFRAKREAAASQPNLDL